MTSSLYVCVSADEKYALYAANALYSLARNYSGDYLAIFYFEDNLSVSSKIRTARILKNTI